MITIFLIRKETTMIKLYEKIIQILKENYKFLILLLLMIAFCTYEFPYYVDAPGGIINISSKMEVSNGYPSKGSFNLAYVSEYKGTLPILLLANLKKDWDIVKKEDIILENETIEENNYRNQLLLKEANHNAIIVAYKNAGKEVQIKNQKLFVTYIAKDGKNDLKVKDQILEVNGISIQGKEDFDNAVKGAQLGDILKIRVLRDQKEKEVQAEVYELDGRIVVGVLLTEEMDLEANPNIKFRFDSTESGPSGGLMMSLAIYNALIEEDITHGKTIVGTGTIESDGTVGEIGGVEYKLKGAVKEHADYFFVPKENYEEALKIKEDNHYEIPIVSVSSFEEALNYLKAIDKKD